MRHYMRNLRARNRREVLGEELSSSDESYEGIEDVVPIQENIPNDVDSTHSDIPSSSKETACSDDYFSDPYDSDEAPGLTWPEIDDHIVLSSSDSDAEYDEKESSLKSKLCKLATDFGATHNLIDHLLKILREEGHKELPATARTLLHTKSVTVEEKSGVKCVFYGMREQLKFHLSAYPQELLRAVTNIELSFNLDGIPIFKSSKSDLWPFLCAVHLEPPSVFPIVLAYGHSKPQDLEFLEAPIQSIKEVVEQGIIVKEVFLPLTIRAIVCDAPAKAFAKNIKQFNGYFGCDHCDQPGNHLGGRQLFLESTDLNPRTDASFREMHQPGHHKGPTPFQHLDIDLIHSFPLDYMHLCCLGVNKKLLLAWVKGEKPNKISSTQRHIVSDALLGLQPFIPNEFARKPRGLDELDRWKATEHRLFLVYIGKVVLVDILKPEFYRHFLALSLAMCILVCPRLCVTYLHFAKELLVFFVKQGHRLYGDDFMTYNVHSLVHLCDDVKVHGVVDNFSAFEFENYLQTLKKKVKSGKNPVVQIARRLSEIQQQEKLVKKVKFSDKRPNNAYILDGDACCEVRRTTSERDTAGNKLAMCRICPTPEALSADPWDLSLIGAFKVNWRRSYMQMVPERLLTRKAIMIDNGRHKSIFLAVLHEF